MFRDRDEGKDDRPTNRSLTPIGSVGQ